MSKTAAATLSPPGTAPPFGKKSITSASAFICSADGAHAEGPTVAAFSSPETDPGIGIPGSAKAVNALPDESAPARGEGCGGGDADAMLAAPGAPAGLAAAAASIAAYTSAAAAASPVGRAAGLCTSAGAFVELGSTIAAPAFACAPPGGAPPTAARAANNCCTCAACAACAACGVADADADAICANAIGLLAKSAPNPPALAAARRIISSRVCA